MTALSEPVSALITYSFPVAAWLIWKKKTNASALPLVIGLVAYTCVILPRFMLRALISYNELRQTNIFLYYFARGIISGGCEEGIRLAVFTFILKSSDKSGWVNSIAYGLGHGACESLLVTDLADCGLADCVFNGLGFLENMAFSASMSVLVYAAAVHARDKKLFFAAYALHFCADVIPLFYELEGVSFVGYLLLDMLFSAGCCVFAFKVFRSFRDE
ncbi:MAG: YhfC family intramembrane metalloprotease [Ruminococcus sp.]|nr:YhfC family intramembrane metalloprotease [Ruminococcus sp.]